MLWIRQWSGWILLSLRFQTLPLLIGKHESLLSASFLSFVIHLIGHEHAHTNTCCMLCRKLSSCWRGIVSEVSGKNAPTNCCVTLRTLNNRATPSVRTSTHPHSTSKSIYIPPSGPLSLPMSLPHTSSFFSLPVLYLFFICLSISALNSVQFNSIICLSFPLSVYFIKLYHYMYYINNIAYAF